jgi:hypothetical protein
MPNFYPAFFPVLGLALAADNRPMKDRTAAEN